MNRRFFLNCARAALGASSMPSVLRAAPAPPRMKITRIRFYHNPRSRPIFNQSAHIVTIETDAGITGIGEGGSKDTVEQCAAMIIGEDPAHIDRLWQMMFRG